MITIKVIGLDQFVVGDLSSELTKNIANIYEVGMDDVNFVAPDCMIFHNGVEQTSWHVIIDVMAPKKVQVLQEEMAQYLMNSIKEVAVNIEIIFHYYSQADRVLLVNDDYPRYLSEMKREAGDSDSREETFDYCEGDDCECHHDHGDEECSCGCHHHDNECHCHDEEDDDEIYTGDVFEEYKDLLNKK